MTDEIAEPTGSDAPKTSKAKPIKVLPTDRLAFDKQLSVLRAYAAASGSDRKAVANRDVGSIVQLHENTVSICNPFFQDLGFLIKEGQKNRPSDEVADYAQSFEWDTEKAAHKLASVFRKAWFSAALIPKLTFRPLSKDEATTFLANEAKAPKEYKANLEIILDYLKAVGVIQSDGANITLGPSARENNDNTGTNGKPLNNGNVDISVTPNSGAIPPPPPADNLPPFIKGLINKLPAPDEVWPLADRVKWLTTAANIFDLMYTTPEDSLGVSVSLEGTTVSIRKGQ